MVVVTLNPLIPPGRIPLCSGYQYTFVLKCAYPLWPNFFNEVDNSSNGLWCVGIGELYAWNHPCTKVSVERLHYGDKVILCPNIVSSVVLHISSSKHHYPSDAQRLDWKLSVHGYYGCAFVRFFFMKIYALILDLLASSSCSGLWCLTSLRALYASRLTSCSKTNHLIPVMFFCKIKASPFAV